MEGGQNNPDSHTNHRVVVRSHHFRDFAFGFTRVEVPLSAVKVNQPWRRNGVTLAHQIRTNRHLQARWIRAGSERRDTSAFGESGFEPSQSSFIVALSNGGASNRWVGSRGGAFVGRMFRYQLEKILLCP